QTVRFVADDLAGRLADIRHHRQRARQLPMPRLKRMLARSPVTELETVVASLDDVHHPAWRRLVRIVVHAEHMAITVATDDKRIPKAGGDAAQLRAVGRAVEDLSAVAFAAQHRAVGADQLVRRPEV